MPGRCFIKQLRQAAAGIFKDKNETLKLWSSKVGGPGKLVVYTRSISSVWLPPT